MAASPVSPVMTSTFSAFFLCADSMKLNQLVITVFWSITMTLSRAIATVSSISGVEHERRSAAALFALVRIVEDHLHLNAAILRACNDGHDGSCREPLHQRHGPAASPWSQASPSSGVPTEAIRAACKMILDIAEVVVERRVQVCMIVHYNRTRNARAGRWHRRNSRPPDEIAP